MTMLLQEPPDLTSDYWTVGNRPTVIEVNGGRFYVDHWQRVERARLVADLSGTDLSIPIKLVRRTA